MSSDKIFKFKLQYNGQTAIFYILASSIPDDMSSRKFVWQKYQTSNLDFKNQLIMCLEQKRHQ